MGSSIKCTAFLSNSCTAGSSGSPPARSNLSTRRSLPDIGANVSVFYGKPFSPVPLHLKRSSLSSSATKLRREPASATLSRTCKPSRASSPRSGASRTSTEPPQRRWLTSFTKSVVHNTALSGVTSTRHSEYPATPTFPTRSGPRCSSGSSADSTPPRRGKGSSSSHHYLTQLSRTRQREQSATEIPQTVSNRQY